MNALPTMRGTNISYELRLEASQRAHFTEKETFQTQNGCLWLLCMHSQTVKHTSLTQR